MSDVSPDLTPYIDLALYDRDPQSIFEAALDVAVTKLPGWEPREGNTEVVLLEGLALEASELVFAINRVPGLVTQVLLALFGVERDLGAPAYAQAEFTLSDAFGHVVPAGTALRLELDTDLVVDFTTDGVLQVNPSQTVGTIGITAVVNGAEAHYGTAGQELRLLDAISFVESVTLVDAPTGGRAAESDETYLNRGVQRFARLVTTLVLPSHFTAAALEHPSVFRAKTLDNYDATAGSGAPGDHPGHVTVAVAGPGGEVLSQVLKDEIDASLEEQSMANLAVHVVDPTITDVAVTATLHRQAGYTDQQVIDAATEALDAYLDPDSWDWGDTVRRNELIAILDGVDGVDYVADLTAPAADVALSGYANLVDLGVVSITVTSG